MGRSRERREGKEEEGEGKEKEVEEKKEKSGGGRKRKRTPYVKVPTNEEDRILREQLVEAINRLQLASRKDFRSKTHGSYCSKTRPWLLQYSTFTGNLREISWKDKETHFNPYTSIPRLTFQQWLHGMSVDEVRFLRFEDIEKLRNTLRCYMRDFSKLGLNIVPMLEEMDPEEHTTTRRGGKKHVFRRTLDYNRVVEILIMLCDTLVEEARRLRIETLREESICLEEARQECLNEVAQLTGSNIKGADD